MEHNHEQKTYTCPMHPEVERETGGICPECGMNLILEVRSEKLEIRNRDKHAGHSTEMFLKKFWVNLLLTIPILIFRDASYLTLVLGSIVFFYGGMVFLRGAFGEIKNRLPGMMTLIGIAIFTAFMPFLPKKTLFFGNLPL